jgi:HEAT repeat protein
MAEALRQQMREMREQSGATEDRTAELAARRDEQVRSQADLIEQLRSSNPEMRLEAVEGLDPEGSALTVLLEVLKTDADPRVRQKAAEHCGEAEGYMVCAGLLDALVDREPAVVLQALESLEFTCDATVVPVVEQRCAQAVDPLVQQRCAEAIEFLQ